MARVHSKVDQNLLDVSGVDLHWPQGLFEVQNYLYILAQCLPQHVRHLLDLGV